MSTCPHPDTVLVFGYLHGLNPRVGDRVVVLNDGKAVARRCTACGSLLPINWGCPDCEWVEERILCDPHPTRLLAQPCPAHAPQEPA